MGKLKINGSEGAIRLPLQTVVPGFLARYPGVELDLVAEGSLVDIAEPGFDLGVSLGEAVPKDIIAIRLGFAIRFLADASPVYPASHQAQDVPSTIYPHPITPHLP